MIPEAVVMVCTQVIGNDTTITVAGQAGNFQLNVMLPVVALNLLQSIEILANSAVCLADKAISGFAVNQANLDRALDRNPILVTALNPVIGYEKPSIDIDRSGTRREELLLDEDTLKQVQLLRRMIGMLTGSGNSMNPSEATEKVLERMGKTKSNKDFLANLGKDN